MRGDLGIHLGMAHLVVAVSADLGSHVIACRTALTTAGWRAPDSLRPEGPGQHHLVDLAQPDHAPVGGQLVAVLNLIMPGLPSDRGLRDSPLRG